MIFIGIPKQIFMYDIQMKLYVIQHAGILKHVSSCSSFYARYMQLLSSGINLQLINKNTIVLNTCGNITNITKIHFELLRSVNIHYKRRQISPMQHACD